MIKKCNSTLAFLRRNLSNSPRFVKEKCYTTLVRPKLEYACAIWDPHHQVHIEFFKIDAHIYSFFPQSTAVWKNLPLQVRTSEDLSFFQNEIKNIDLMSIKETVNKI